MIKFRRYYWILLICLPLLMGIDSCFGLREFMQGAKGNSPTEPCAEAIPLPTPIDSATPAAGPDPQNTPIISAGTPIVGVVTVLPTVTPIPLMNVNIQEFEFKCFGNLSPSGLQQVPLGTELSITATASGCTLCTVEVDGGSPTYFSCASPYIYMLKVKKNHTVLFSFWG